MKNPPEHAKKRYANDVQYRNVVDWMASEMHAGRMFFVDFEVANELALFIFQRERMEAHAAVEDEVPTDELCHDCGRHMTTVELMTGSRCYICERGEREEC